MLVCVALNKTVGAEGERVFWETHKLTSRDILVALRLRALPAAYSSCVSEMGANKGSIVTVNTRICYSLGEPGVLGLGLGSDGRHNIKAENGYKAKLPNLLHVNLATVQTHS